MNASNTRLSSWRRWDERRSRFALTVSFTILFLALISVAILLRSSIQAERWVQHSMEVRLINGRLMTATQAAQSAERGAIITGDARYAQRFNEAVRDVDTLRSELTRLTRDNSDQQYRVAQMDNVVAQLLIELRETLRLTERGDRNAAVPVVTSHLKTDLIGKVRQFGDEIDRAEEDLLHRRTQNAGNLRFFLIVAVVVMTCTAAVLLFFVIRALQELLARSRSDARRLEHEIQEREATENQLRQAQKMEALGKLTGGVAHDFNNMLAVIVGNLDILSRHAMEGDARMRRLTNNALDGAKRASELTHRLLAFSRLQPLAPKPLDTNKSVADISIILQRTLGENIALETVLGAGVWHVNVDRPQLESAILNLGINAKHAMPERGGKLTIETANTYLDDSYASRYADVKAGQYVLIAVTDTGLGMPPEVLERAFEPFFTTKPVGSGTGLGLSQVHGFIKQSGGHVSIYSEQNVGTTVKLYLRRYTGPMSEPDSGVQQRALQLPHDALVMVVEDEQGVRQFVLDALRELGVRAIEAENGSAALKLLESHGDIRAMLTDVVMPDMNGRELVDEVGRRWPHIKVLYMTGYTRNAIVHNGVVDPGTRLLTKPFTLKQLEMELQALLG